MIIELSEKPKTRTSSRVASTPTIFGGRFSVIAPLEIVGVTLGVFHGSHRLIGICHGGSSTRIHVPKNCFILFSGYLYHYGDRCLVDGGVIKESLRSFQYIVEKGYVEPDFPGTKKLPDRFSCYDSNFNICQDYEQIIRTSVKNMGMEFGKT